VTSSDIFEGIAAVSQLGMAIAVGLGVAVAFFQLRAGRQERTFQRRGELAEDLAVAISLVEDAFKNMRNPFDTVPAERTQDRVFIYQKRYERISDSNDAFSRLREIQVRWDAVCPHVTIKSNVTALHNFRKDIAIAVETLVEDAKDNHDRVPKDELNDAHDKLFGFWGDRDEFGQKIESDMQIIRNAINVVSKQTGLSK
jgi:hypothetical protein